MKVRRVRTPVEEILSRFRPLKTTHPEAQQTKLTKVDGGIAQG